MIKLLTNEATPGGSVSTFQWSTSEQVWPFEKHNDGSTLYCKEINLGTLPNGGTLTKAHGGINSNKIKRLLVRAYTTNGMKPIPWGAWAAASYDHVVSVDDTNIYIVCAYNNSSYSGVAEIIYFK